MRLERGVECSHGGVAAQCGDAGHGIVADPARHDAGKMAKVGIDIDGKTMERHPAAHPYAQRADLRLSPVAVIGPDADPPVRPPRRYAEISERRDHPAFEMVHEIADILAALAQVDVEIADPLPRPMIGVAAAAPGIIDGETRVQQFGRVGAGPGRIERGMLQQPHPFARFARMDRSGARLHLGQRRRVIGRRGFGAPFDAVGKGKGGRHDASLTWRQRAIKSPRYFRE